MKEPNKLLLFIGYFFVFFLGFLVVGGILNVLITPE